MSPKPPDAPLHVLYRARIGWDPATASGPLITSLADISGVLIYFSIATWFLGLAMPWQ